MPAGINVLHNKAHRVSKSYDIGTTNLGIAAHTVFTTSGMVMVEFLGALCREDLAGATATIELGVAGDTAGLIAQITATDLDNAEIWADAGPSTLETAILNKVISADVILTVATAALTDGKLDIVCLWRPLTIGANLSL